MIVLSREEVEKFLDFDALVGALEIAMKDLSSGRSSVPARIAAVVEDCGGSLLAMPAYSPSLEALAAKLVTVFPHNVGNMPTHQALILAFDPATGEPLALMDGTYITAARTAAGSALATKLLAGDGSTLAILGTGTQARAHASAIPRVREIKEIRIAGRDYDKACLLAADVGGIALRTYKEACAGANIVCATVHPTEPVVRWEFLSPGTHVNSVGTSLKGMEVDLETISKAKVFVEQRAAATAPAFTGSNELHSAIRDGPIDVESLTEIGEVLMGVKPGRLSSEEITVYKSVGVAIQDAAAVHVVLKALA